MDKLNPDKLDIVPKDGVILSTQRVAIQEGDSVFDVLLRETKSRGIQMEFVNTPAFNTNYVRGIYNIYEKDCGTTSGWMYTVNGKRPVVGSSTYKLKSGDAVQWIFTCG